MVGRYCHWSEHVNRGSICKVEPRKEYGSDKLFVYNCAETANFDIIDIGAQLGNQTSNQGSLLRPLCLRRTFM